MKIYVAGPMSGYQYYNFYAFSNAALDLTRVGNDVQTPFDTNSRVWQKHYGRNFDPFVDTCDYGDPKLDEMWAENVAAIAWAEGIALLPGWLKSKGARLEVATGSLLHKKFFEYDPKAAASDEDGNLLVPVQLLVNVDVVRGSPALLVGSDPT